MNKNLKMIFIKQYNLKEFNFEHHRLTKPFEMEVFKDAVRYFERYYIDSWKRVDYARQSHMWTWPILSLKISLIEHAGLQ